MIYLGIANQSVDWSRAVERAEDYIKACAACREGAKGHARFANLAGFCRFLGVGVAQFEHQMAAFPEDYGLICAMLEDEALNSDLTASLLSIYLKKRLAYGDKDDEKHACDAGELRLIFEHDILEAGI